MDDISTTTGDVRWSTRTRRPVRHFPKEQAEREAQQAHNEYTTKVEEQDYELTIIVDMAAQRQRSTTSSSSSLSSLPSSSASLDRLFVSFKVASAERAKWLVDNLDEAPDNRGLKPKLRRPNFQKSKDASLLARFVDGGPCYICKATKSCDMWHSNLYMKRPVAKASAVSADGFNRLEKECYEWYCSECYQLDVLKRKVIGGACDVCGKHETIDRFETHMFNSHDDAPRRICSGCYEEDYNKRAGILNEKHKKMHDEWNGQKVVYGNDMRSGASSINLDDDADILDTLASNRRSQNAKKPKGRGKWPRKPRQPVVESEEDTSNVSESTQTETEDDADATINDETLIDPDVSQVSRGSRQQSRGLREDTAYSSGPDDESHSPRLARRPPSSLRQDPTPVPPRAWAQPSGRFSFEAALATANDPDLTLEDYLSRESSVVSSGQPGDRAPPGAAQNASQNVVLPVRERAHTPVHARLEAARRPAPATMVGGRRRGTSRRPPARRE